MRFKIFISSVQSEFAEERQKLVEFLAADALLGKFFDVFAFENLPAVNHNPQKVYIDEVKQSNIYLGLFGKEYGFEDAKDVSPTEREFDCAVENHKIKIAFTTNHSNEERNPKEQNLIKKAVNFVLSNIDVETGARDKSVQVDVIYELPVRAVTETIVNAIAHRDYTSNASVQVMLFKDRLEVLKQADLLERKGASFDGYWEVILPENIEKSREKIITLIENNKFITQTEIAEATGLSIKSIEKNIQQLKSENLLERVGADKGGCWKIIKNENL